MRNSRRNSDEFYEVGTNWVTLDAKARLMEESKTTVLAQRQSVLGDIPVSRAEQIVKASPEWEAFIQKMVHARTEANLAKIKLETAKMRHMEDQSDAANERAMTRLSA